MSRGATIITQKENKGEYNGIQDSMNLSTAWKWNATSDYDIYAHVFDQNGKRGTTNGIPIRYASNTTDYLSTDNIPQCSDDYSTTSGDRLYSDTLITDQKSCNPNTLNAGNWYSFPAATAGSNNGSTSTATNMPNSICPKGWQLPPNADNPNEPKKSYNNLIRTAYKITSTTSDSGILSTPLSFVRLGYYRYDYGSLNNRGSRGYGWSSTAYSSAYSRSLDFNSGALVPQYGRDRAYGLFVRCVSR